MNHRPNKFLSLCILQIGFSGFALGQDHPEHGSSSKKVEPPKVFLDKSPKVVEYQLKRLSNAQLLLIEVATDHPKYVPVFSAIAVRPGMSAEQRETAVVTLGKLNGQSIAETVFEQLAKLNATDREQQRVASDLTALLLTQSADQLPISALTDAASNKSPLVCQAAMAALINSGKVDAARELASNGGAARVGFLAAATIVAEDEKTISILSNPDQPSLL